MTTDKDLMILRFKNAIDGEMRRADAPRPGSKKPGKAEPTTQSGAQNDKPAPTTRPTDTE